MKLKKEKKEKKKKQKAIPNDSELNDVKVNTVKTDTLMKVGRIVLWAVILFLLLRGVISLLQPRSDVIVQEMISAYQEDAERRERVQIGAAAFAESFANEYYTCLGSYDKDYAKRLKPYLAKNNDIKAPLGSAYATTVRSSKAQKIIYIDELNYDVDVHLKVDYKPIAEGTDAKTKEVYIRVPVSADDKGNYAVTSMPMYVPVETAANISNVSTYSGTSVESAEKQSIKETLSSFFPVYFGGSANEISYYVTADSNIKKTAAGMVEFKNINSVVVVRDSETGDFLVDAELTVSDDGTDMKQRIFLRMIYEKKHYYVKEINTRPI